MSKKLFLILLHIRCLKVEFDFLTRILQSLKTIIYNKQLIKYKNTISFSQSWMKIMYTITKWLH